jgi:tRNA threonylcarbamoyladenosine biosynthesis protein TsaE
LNPGATPAGAELAPVQLRTRSADDTRALGRALARALRPGDMVLLAGDLGSGKTTLAQGVAAGLGVVDRVTSPTFTLVRSYPCPHPETPGGHDDAAGSAVRTFLHADLYRLESLGEVVDLALAELVEDGRSVAVVEWGDAGASVLGDDALVVHLAPAVSDDERCLSITFTGSWSVRRDEIDRLLSRWTAP